MSNDTARAIFLDRDGTMIEDKDYLTDENDIEMFPGTPDAIKLLRNLGYLVIVVSNQSGVARGYLTEQRVHEINEEVFKRLEEDNARPDMFFYCPHYPNAEIEDYAMECDCRKPRPGMIRMAQQIVEIDLASSISIGDKLSDVQLCRNLGGRGVLVLTGHGRSELEQADAISVKPDHVASTLLDAARWIEKNPG